MGKGQVNDQDGHVGDGHVEAEAREVAAARGAERDGPLRGGKSTPRPPCRTAGDHLLERSGRCVAVVALVERSRLAVDRGELARVRLVRLGGRRSERRGGRRAPMRLRARDCSVYDRSAVSSLGEHGCVAWICHAEGGGRGDNGVIATRVPLATRTCRQMAAFCPHSCGAVIARTASGASRVAPWPAATEVLLSS